MNTPKLFHLPTKDSILTMAENEHLPFPVKRIFWLPNVEKGAVRGEHAHKTSQQLLVCLNGSIDVNLENLNHEKFSYELSEPNLMLYIPPMHWGKIVYHKPSTVLGIASDEFDESDYIRDYELFKSKTTEQFGRL